MFDWFKKLFVDYSAEDIQKTLNKQASQANKEGVTTTPYAALASTEGAYQAALKKAQAAGASPAIKPQQDVVDLINKAQGLYQSLFGNIDALAKERTGQVNDNYNLERESANKSFIAGSNALDRAYAARGTTDSSYRTNAVKEATDNFDLNIAQLGKSRDQNLANIGQYAATAKAGLQPTLDTLNQYRANAANYDPTALRNNLMGIISNGQQQQAGMGTQGQYLNQLNGIVPLQQQATAQLQAQLDALASSSAPTFAKQQVAKGYLASSGADQNTQNYWQKYFENLLKRG